MKLFRDKKSKQSSMRRKNPEVDDVSIQHYRRGTTLTNFSEERQEKTERQKEKMLRARRRKIGVIFLMVTIVCILGGLLLTEFKGSINDIISNVAVIDREDADRYRNLVNEYFIQNPFERFDFARRDNELNNHVRRYAPEIKNIEIVRDGFLRSNLEIEFRQPLVMWTINQRTDYVDAYGFVFSKNYFSNPAIKIIDNSGVESDSESPISARFLRFVGQVVSHLNDKNHTVEYVKIPMGAIRYVEFYLSGREYPFKAQIDRNPFEQAADIVAIARYLDQRGIVPQYVDVRVSGKAFWR